MRPSPSRADDTRIDRSTRHGRWADRGNRNGSQQDHSHPQRERFLGHWCPGGQPLGPLAIRAARRSKRDFLSLLVLAVLFYIGSPAVAKAAEKVYRVGVLAPEGMHAIQSFKQRLHELGWIEGKNIRFDYRSTEGDDTRQPALAAELVGLPVDLILTWGTPATLAAKQATATIPIVIGSIGDPVTVAAVPNLAHPGRNVTGFASQSFELEEKRFELLRELVPGMTRIVMLGNTGNLYADLAIKRLEPLVEAAGLKFEAVKIDAENGLERGLEAVRRARPDGVLVAAIPAFYTPRVYRPMVAFMATNRLPAIYSNREFVEAGGLIAYSTNFDDLLRQAASYVDKILKGAAPGELPVQQAATFELLVNLATAKVLGLTIPPLILARADEVIE
jgi:putative tryptophan/tyrosine transport system substrate-binding protein